MKPVYVIKDLYRNQIGEDLFGKIASLWPPGVSINGKWFYYEFRSDYDVFFAICKTMEDAGWRQSDAVGSATDRVFVVKAGQEPEEHDLLAAELLWCTASTDVKSWGMTRGNDPVLEITIGTAKAAHRIDSAIINYDFYSRPVVPQRVRSLLEAGNLIGLDFKPVRLTQGLTERRRFLEWAPPYDPWWELSSNRFMPPVSPTMQLRITPGPRSGEKVAPGFTETWVQAVNINGSGLYIRYRRSDLERMEAFDIAVSIERFSVDTRYIVVSQKFFRYCREKALNFTFRPVKIEEQ